MVKKQQNYQNDDSFCIRFVKTVQVFCCESKIKTYYNNYTTSPLITNIMKLFITHINIKTYAIN